MKTLITLAVFVWTTVTFTQEKEANYSKWKEVRDGKKYAMEVAEELLNAKPGEKPSVVFSIAGEVSLLAKVTLVQKERLITILPLQKEAKEIKVEPGVYTFKFYHKKIGEKEFEVNFKKGDHKVVKLSLK